MQITSSIPYYTPIELKTTSPSNSLNFHSHEKNSSSLDFQASPITSYMSSPPSPITKRFEEVFYPEIPRKQPVSSLHFYNSIEQIPYFLKKALKSHDVVYLKLILENQPEAFRFLMLLKDEQGLNEIFKIFYSSTSNLLEFLLENTPDLLIQGLNEISLTEENALDFIKKHPLDSRILRTEIQLQLISLIKDKKNSGIIPHIKMKISNYELKDYFNSEKIHFLLDKIPSSKIKNEDPLIKYESGSYRFNLLTLVEALFAVETQLPETFQNCLQPLSSLIQAFIHCAEWEILIETHPNERTAKQLVEWMRSHLSKHPLLLPYSTSVHGMLLLIEKTSSHHVEILLFNTGQLKHQFHPNYPKTNLYQTYIHFENVPIENLLNESFWLNVFVETTLKQPENLYALFCTLGESGERCLPSSKILDYEKTQNRGTCTAQASMAVLRYWLLKSSPGSDFYKKGTYKFLKLFTQLYIAKKNETLMDPQIKPFLDRKIEKHRTSLKIFSLLNHQSQVFDKICLKIDELLNIKTSFKHKRNSVEQYEILRNFGNILAQKNLTSQNIQELSHLAPEFGEYTQSVKEERAFLKSFKRKREENTLSFTISKKSKTVT